MARNYNPPNYNNPNYDPDDDELDNDASGQLDDAQINNAAAQRAAGIVTEAVPNALPGSGAPPADQLEQEVPVNTASGGIEADLISNTQDDEQDLDAIGTLDDSGAGTDEEMPLDAGASDEAAAGTTDDTTTVEETEEDPDQVSEEDALFDDSSGNIDETIFDDEDSDVSTVGQDGVALGGNQDLSLDLDEEGDSGFSTSGGEELDPNYDLESETIIEEDDEDFELPESDYGEDGNIEEVTEEEAQTFRDMLEENLMAKMMEDAQSAGQRDAGRAIAAARAQAGRGQMGMSGGMIAAQSDAVSNAVANAEDRLFNQQLQAGRLGAGMETEDRNQLITAIGVAEDLGMDDDELRSFIETVFPDMDADLIQDFGLGLDDEEVSEEEVVTETSSPSNSLGFLMDGSEMLDVNPNPFAQDGAKDIMESAEDFSSLAGGDTMELIWGHNGYTGEMHTVDYNGSEYAVVGRKYPGGLDWVLVEVNGPAWQTALDMVPADNNLPI